MTAPVGLMMDVFILGVGALIAWYLMCWYDIAWYWYPVVFFVALPVAGLMLILFIVSAPLWLLLFGK